MAEQAEQSFIKNFANVLSSQPVAYADDYQQPPQNSLKRVPVLPIDLPPPPEKKRETAENAVGNTAAISITFKSLKPPQSFTLSVQPTDTISDIKASIASQPRAPPANAQRLLYRGKALADPQLLKEYNIKAGETVNLMVRPGYENDSNPTIAPIPVPAPSRIHTNLSKPPSTDNLKLGGSRHQRIPSVVLSPSPAVSPSASPKPMDINLTLDTSNIPTASLSSTVTETTYHTVIARPEYWEHLRDFLSSQFTTDSDVLIAFEDYLRASKGALSAHEVAKIRDQVGVIGMAGT